MHQTLQIQEILLNIFGHRPLPASGPWQPSDLPALARTCRAFKEPALDVLWEKLVDPSPLAKCLPEASHYGADGSYWFSRSLTQIEWGILRSYTRRIRSISDESPSILSWESVGSFLSPPSTEPLFPNLCVLRVNRITEIEIQHFLTMPFPSLIALEVRGISPKKDSDVCALQDSLESFFKFSPNIKRFSIELQMPDIAFSKFISSYICLWRDLRHVDCVLITLDMDTLAHLSRMPELTQLRCTPSDTLPPSKSPIFYSNLHHLTLSSQCLTPISQLLSRTQLPAITNVTAYIESCPSKQRFSSFLASVLTSHIGHTIQELKVEQFGNPTVPDRGARTLGFEDLQPCTVFSNLRSIYLDISWDVDLTDSELLALASAWPHLETFVINAKWGWDTLGGITPNGVLQLLQICRSLSSVALTIDTRGYTEFRESPASLGLRLPPTFFINVLESPIEEESVPAIAAFLAGIVPRPCLCFTIAHSWNRRSSHAERWQDVYQWANDAVSQRSFWVLLFLVCQW